MCGTARSHWWEKFDIKHEKFLSLFFSEFEKQQMKKYVYIYNINVFFGKQLHRLTIIVNSSIKI